GAGPAPVGPTGPGLLRWVRRDRTERAGPPSAGLTRAGPIWRARPECATGPSSAAGVRGAATEKQSTDSRAGAPRPLWGLPRGARGVLVGPSVPPQGELLPMSRTHLARGLERRHERA